MVPDPLIGQPDLATISAVVEDVVDEAQSDAAATIASATETAETTLVVLPSRVAPAATQPIDASVAQAAAAMALLATDAVDVTTARLDALPGDEPSLDADAMPEVARLQQALQTAPVHDSWALERSAVAVVEDLAAIEPGGGTGRTAVEPSAVQPSRTAQAIAAEDLANTEAVATDLLNSSAMAHAPEPFAAQSLAAPPPTGSTSTDPVLPEPTPPFSALPASVGLSSTAAAGWLPSFAQLTVLDTWRPLSPRAPGSRSVIVVPNLAPPG
jgi:hypothetical protein